MKIKPKVAANDDRFLNIKPVKHRKRCNHLIAIHTKESGFTACQSCPARTCSVKGNSVSCRCADHLTQSPPQVSTVHGGVVQMQLLFSQGSLNSIGIGSNTCTMIAGLCCLAFLQSDTSISDTAKLSSFFIDEMRD